MSPAELLAAAASAGLALRVEAGALRVRGPHAAITEWAPRLKERKPELIALLQDTPRLADQGNPAALPPREAWGERAAVLEFDGGLSRAEAEEQATCHRWLIHLPDGWRDSTFTPPASQAELRRWYPAAALIPADDDLGDAEPGYLEATNPTFH